MDSLFFKKYNLIESVNKILIVNMIRKICLFVLVGAVSVLQAQKLEKTGLKIEKFKGMFGIQPNSAVIQGFGSDENNYYVYYSFTTLMQKVEPAFFVIDKNLTTAKEYSIAKDKEDRFLKVLTTEEDMIILLVRNKKDEQKSQIIKQAYSKSTGKLKKETVIASFPKSKSDHWYFYSSSSPDNKKTGFLFLLVGKKNSVDSYYASVLNENCEVEWSAVHDLEVSNESFSIQDITVTNKGDICLAFWSQPENIKKSANKKSYIDLIYLADGAKEKTNYLIDEKYKRVQVELKALKNNDIYLAGLFSVDRYATKIEFISAKLNGNNFNLSDAYKKQIEDKGTKDKFSTVIHLYIEKILELENGDIAVLCEQAQSIIVQSNSMTTYTKSRFAVTSLFVSGKDASVENISVMRKVQSHKSNFDCSPKSLHLSIFPFVYGNKVGYLFNDNLKRYATPHKYKKESGFRSGNGEDACIVLNTQSEGEKAEITPLTGLTPANRLIRQILFEEDNRLILLTRNKKEAYIEILSLP